MVYDNYRPILGAHVSGITAQWIVARIPRASMEDTCRHFHERGRPDLAQSIHEGWRDIEAAAQEHAKAARAASISVGGRAKDPETEMPRALKKEQITPEAAATVLGTTSSRVRQHLRSGRLRGKQVGGRWAIEPEDLNEFRLGRSA
ncbi:helix-turn-helix domain-containing protein [bacterium RCC_150]